MKNLKAYIAVLLVLPLLMVLVAANPSGVTVFDGETTRYLSWFQTVPESIWGWCAPVAGLLNYLLFGLAVIYGLNKKSWCLQAIMGIAFVASCVAALPVVAQSDIKIVPNVMGILLLVAESFVAYAVKKEQDKAVQAAKPKGKSLKRR